MAHTNAPTHDFAPPWLKIPSYDSPKPSGADSSERSSGSGYTSHKENHSYASSACHTKESDNFSSRHPPYHDSRRERNAYSGDRKHSYLSSYHHSIDFEDPYFEGNGYHNSSYPGVNCNGTSSNSHVSMRRPHSRHDFRNGPSYGKGDLFNNHMKSNGSGYHNNRTKSKFPEPSANSNSIFSENPSGISNNFNQEFPSLQGDISEEPVSTPVNGSVWEKPRNIKVHGSGMGKKLQLVKKTASQIDSTADNSKRSILASSSSLSGSVLSSSGGGGGPASSNSHTVIVTPVAKSSSCTYRALVPAKTTSTKKQLICSKDGGPAKMLSVAKRPPLSSPAPNNHPMEILVKHPKACGNKSEFLKALRNENQKEAQEKNSKNSPASEGELCSKEEEGDKQPSNGIDIEKLNISNDNEKPLLSSSLEAEQRLLREMGWKEDASDDDNYAPLTEDEMREFKALSEQMVKKNGFRRSLQANFSPRRLAPYSPSAVSLPADEACTSSSSSSESDSDF